MSVGGVSLLAGLMPAAHDGATPAATPDGADAFAAMMAGIAKPPAMLSAAPADDAKDTASARDKSHDEGAGQDDKDSRKAQDDSDAALMTMLGVPVPPTAAPSAAPTNADVQTASASASAFPVMRGRSAPTQPAIPIIAQSAKGKVAQQAEAGREDSASATKQPDAFPTSGDATVSAEPTPREGGIEQHLLLARLQQQAAADSDKGRPSEPVTAPIQRDTTPAAPVSSVQNGAPAFMQNASSGSTPGAAAQAMPPAMPVVLGPLPATAALMVARAAAGKPAASAGDSQATRKPEHEEDHAEAGAGSVETARMATPTTLTSHASASVKASSSTPVDNAGQMLAAGTADRHLDVARQGAWLDGLARDIASAGASSGTVRFQVSPEHLGTVQVELKHGDDGSAVTLTATSEASRTALANAQPQLIAEARAHGLHIASTQVDVGQGDSGSGRDSQQQQSGSSQSDSRSHHTPQGGGFSSQTGGGNNTGQRSQTRSQLLPEYQSRTARTDRGGASEAPASKISSAAADARYA